MNEKILRIIPVIADNLIQVGNPAPMGIPISLCVIIVGNIIIRRIFVIGKIPSFPVFQILSVPFALFVLVVPSLKGCIGIGFPVAEN